MFRLFYKPVQAGRYRVSWSLNHVSCVQIPSWNVSYLFKDVCIASRGLSIMSHAFRFHHETCLTCSRMYVSRLVGSQSCLMRSDSIMKRVLPVQGCMYRVSWSLNHVSCIQIPSWNVSYLFKDVCIASRGLSIMSHAFRFHHETCLTCSRMYVSRLVGSRSCLMRSDSIMKRVLPVQGCMYRVSWALNNVSCVQIPSWNVSYLFKDVCIASRGLSITSHAFRFHHETCLTCSRMYVSRLVVSQ